MKRSAPPKEVVVTTATPLASMPPEPVIVESEKAKTAEGTEKETPPVVVLEPEVAIEEQPALEKAKAIEEQPKPQKAKAIEEELAPEKAMATE